MAKHNVICSCGHEETIELLGAGKDRERKIENMADDIIASRKRNLSNDRMCRVDDYGPNIEIYIFDAGENEALCNISVNVDDCREFSFKENLENCFDKIREFVALTEEDKEQIEDELEIPLYNMSLDAPYREIHFISENKIMKKNIRTALEWEEGTINYVEEKYFGLYYGVLYIMDDGELEDMYEIAKKEDDTTPDNLDDYAKELCRNALMEAFQDKEIVKAGMDWDHPERFKEMLMNLKKEIC